MVRCGVEVRNMLYRVNLLHAQVGRAGSGSRPQGKVPLEAPITALSELFGCCDGLQSGEGLCRGVDLVGAGRPKVAGRWWYCARQ